MCKIIFHSVSPEKYKSVVVTYLSLEDNYYMMVTRNMFYAS